MKKVLILVMALCMGLAVTASAAVQFNRYEAFSGGIDDVVAWMNANDPTLSQQLATYLIPEGGDALNNYCAEVYGYITPPESGMYVFWTASDDSSRLFLSTNYDENDVQQIANVDGWTGSQAWYNNPSQQSEPVFLVGGAPYYIWSYMQEGGGGDNHGAAWWGPTISESGTPQATLIDGSYVDVDLPAYPGVYPVSPEPMDISVDVAVSEIVFIGSNPDVVAVPTYKVYFGVDPNDAEMIYEGQATTAALTSSLDYNTPYYYKVDVIEPNDVPGEPDGVYPGEWWSFTTKPEVPEFTTPLSGTVVIGEGTTGSLSFAYASVRDVTGIVWKKGDTEIASGDENFTTLTLENVTNDDAGMYYVVVTNTAGPATSGPVEVKIGHEIAYWPFDTDADDYSGNEHHNRADVGGYNGGAQVAYETAGATANTGGCISFNGNNMSYVSSGTWVPDAETGQVSWALWAKWDGTGGQWQGLAGQRQSWSAGNMSWQFELNTSNRNLEFKREGGTTPGGYTVTADQWFHYAVTVSGSTATTYINGNQQSQSAWSFGNDRDSNWAVGACELGTIGGGAGNMFVGDIDEFHVFDYALSPYDVKQVYVDETGVSECWEGPAGLDFDNNCAIGLGDLMIVLEEWTECNLYPQDLCN